MSQDETLRAIEGLEGKKFVIPHYQRGYRWGESEVRALLEDIWDFAQTKNNFTQGQFYCLQPVVVKKSTVQYNVIDGQQRLTTIFLIIKYLKNENFFDISYETRQDSANFLQNIQDKSEKELENIDFYHFYNAYHQTITKFFEGKYDEYKNINKDYFLEVLLDKCKILWYEIDSKENENEVFIRLNIGKIPLVEAENIKALFLSKNDELDSDELKDRAEFWYEGELKARENGDFRYCVLSKVGEKDIIDNKEGDIKPFLSDDISRIEVYLKSIVPNKKDKNYLFNHFYKHYKNKTLNDEWEKLKDAINTLSGFANKGSERIDREIFHYLGFLIYIGDNIHSLYEEWIKNTDKNIFAIKLLERIQNKMSKKIEDIEQLNYEKDKQDIQNLLLLFNLEYLIATESLNEYFEFNRFVLEKWSVEHIYAQNSESIQDAINGKNNDSIKEWLEETLNYIEDKTLKEKIQQKKKEEYSDSEDWKDFFNEINENFKTNETLHTIQNLTLLDKNSNSKVGKYIFSKKRELIKEIRKERGKLIPICTEKVFEKDFSKKDTSHPNIFGKKDQEDYFEAIKECLEKYKKIGAK